ncbi:SgcJ/EcaC family oxidoreductase [Bailinhaonella thermotolerans]|uniref:SgcJ/EcaC family oxidoreductase n=1 Tax=Bailinhaonella thermotolerans TaxID=1070861 RepID=A0A3A4AKZ6_9ACTN|nr:SgcJ/EcaC family oxidoreductase [Bailinhaonella thermotolerans]RJL26453.1 SgcJ/EcaC family oxidoreductase [Bailinhaonella thermotolerans]
MSTREQDIAAIERLVRDAARLQSDVDGFTGLLTEDAVIVNFGGRVVRGRAEIAEAMRQALASPLADVITENELEDIRFPRPDVALVGFVKHVSDRRDPKVRGAELEQRGRSTFVLVKEDGRWLVSYAQTTPIRA